MFHSFKIAMLFFFVGAIVATAQENHPAKNLPLPGEVFTYKGRTAFIISPADIENKEAERPWIWYAPTLPPYPGQAERWMFEQFLDAGIAIAGIDVGESYGSLCGTAEFSDFYEYLVSERVMAKRPGLLARSRGGLMLLNWAVEHPDQVSCLGGIYPVFDLSSYPGTQRAQLAYHLPEEDLQLYLSKFNPVPRVEALAKNAVPIYCLHGDNDTVVLLEYNSGSLAAEYWKHGGPLTLVVHQGQGHNMWPVWFQNQPLVDFMIQHLTADSFTSNSNAHSEQ